MKSKAAWIAWAYFAFVCLASFQEMVEVLENPKPGASPSSLATDLVLGVVINIVFVFVGALIITRQPRNLIGWLLLVPPTTLVLGGLLPDYASWSSAPAQTSLGLYLGVWLSGWSWVLLIFPIFLIALLFPTGRPPSRRWNWVAYLALAMIAILTILGSFSENLSLQDASWSLPNPIGFIPDEWWSGSLFLSLWGLGLVVLAVSSVASLVVRFRRASAVEREQIKWLLYACGLFGGSYAFLVLFIFTGLIPDSTGYSLIIFLAMATIPIAIAFAVLRYRLWDIDVIIRRTLVYGVLTVALGLVFFGGVVLLQQAFGALTGTENSPVAIVISTLAIAALFNPLRKRVQDFIDRRFYRRKYNAELSLKRFTELARSETDIEQLQAEILAVVQETMQPEKVTLWLRRQG